MAYDRQEIADAIFARLASIEGVVTAEKRLRTIVSVQPAEQPYVAIVPTDSRADREPGKPTVWTLLFQIHLFVNVEGDEDGPLPMLNKYVHKIEGLFDPKIEDAHPHARFRQSRGACTLGGLVGSAAVTGADLYVGTDGEGLSGSQGAALVELEVVTTA